MSYAQEVGGRLRRLRLQRGLSLQDVERSSGGAWKAAVVGSYERGDRNISAARLCELADFYHVAPADILPGEDVPPTIGTRTGIVVDLARLERHTNGEWAGVHRFVASIQAQRGDFNRSMLSVRGEDLRALAVIAGSSVDQLVDALLAADLIVDG